MRPGCARMDRLTIGPQLANLPHKVGDPSILNTSE